MSYHVYGLNLTQGQTYKLQEAANGRCPVSIRLSHSNLSGENKMLLIQRQKQKIDKLLKSAKGGRSWN